jgi:hypothetical protein
LLIVDRLLDQGLFDGTQSLLDSADGDASERITMTSVLQIVTRFVRDNWSILLILGGLLAARLLLQTPSTPLASAEEFEQRIRGGRPVALYVFNNT